MTTHTAPQISEQQTLVEEDLVLRVLDSFERCKDPRLKEVMQSLTTHLHNFIRDVRLMEEEWTARISPHPCRPYHR